MGKIQFGFAAGKYMSPNTAETVKKSKKCMWISPLQTLIFAPPSPAVSFFLQASGPIALNCILELPEKD
jgi:hypothetical protein